MRYEITFAELASDHIDFLTAAERATVLAAIERQLVDEPLVETRNRKRLRSNPLAPLQLRVGDLRVFYRVVTDPPVVRIVAIGKKSGNVLRIAGKEVQL